MSRRQCLVSQADVRRIIRAAKQEGASEVEVRLGEQTKIYIKLSVSSTDDGDLPKKREPMPL